MLQRRNVTYLSRSGRTRHSFPRQAESLAALSYMVLWLHRPNKYNSLPHTVLSFHCNASFHRSLSIKKVTQNKMVWCWTPRNECSNELQPIHRHLQQLLFYGCLAGVIVCYSFDSIDLPSTQYSVLTCFIKI